MSDLEQILVDVEEGDLGNVLGDVQNVFNDIPEILDSCLNPPEPHDGTDKCVKTCTNDGYSTPYDQDKHKSVKAYSLGSVKSIQADLMTYGPLSVAYIVYEDFPMYKSGVYHHVKGKQLGGHAVKLVGWGETDQGEEYWTIVNSWGDSWGEDGSFRIRRGTDECGIETMSVDAGRVE